MLSAVIAGSLTALSVAADAACSLTGKWHSLMVAPGAQNQNGAGTVVGGCRLTITATGHFTGTCESQALGDVVKSNNVSGTLKTNAKCEMSGVWRVPGFPDANVLVGFASGNLAAFTAVRGTTAFQIRSVILIKG
jgi:hypothetical protein